MQPLELVRLTALMERTSGRPEVAVGLIDGPVATDHPELAGATIRVVPNKLAVRCVPPNSPGCLHGTLVAGILCGRRGSVAPAICPDCTLIVRPIFLENRSGSAEIPSATPKELAEAIIECIESGARVLNMSVALAGSSTKGDGLLQEALDFAAKRATIIVAAGGNQGTLSSSAITRHACG